MSRIGIVGGLSPESTVTYYQYLTRTSAGILGGSRTPEIVIFSVDLERYHRWRDAGRWDLVTGDLVKAAGCLERCGVDLALIATNTMHKVFAEVAASTSIRLVSIIDTTIDAIRARGLKRVALIGTRFTMIDDFFRAPLAESGIDCLVPEPEDIAYIHASIENELVKGRFVDATRDRYLAIVDGLIARGAEGVILGCTEIPLLIDGGRLPVPAFDTATLHADAVLRIWLERHETVSG